MILNRNEFVLMNNPIRALVQRGFEANRLLRLGGRLAGGAALELGCGPGFGTRLILDVFGAQRVDTFDLDPRMVALTRARLGPAERRVRLWVGDASAIPVADEAYDAVFDFGVIHHVPDWRRAVTELSRVLKPGGRLYMEEVLAGFLDRRVARCLFAHPRADRFGAIQLREAVRTAGFLIEGEQQLWGAFSWIAGYKAATSPGAAPDAARVARAPQSARVSAPTLDGSSMDDR
jgi:ubiquinone/menaquinone biosynthesis C-methylase UbiE